MSSHVARVGEVVPVDRARHLRPQSRAGEQQAGSSQLSPEAGSDRLAGYAVRLGGNHVLLNSRQAVLDVLRALELAQRAMAADGLPVPARVSSLMRLLNAELVETDAESVSISAAGNAEVPQTGDLPTSIPGAVRDDTVTTQEVAQMLGITARQARNLAGRFGARRVAGSWRFDRQVVTDEMVARQRREERAM